VTDHPIILFDGVCNLCNGAVNFVLAQDRKDVFRFATLQSDAGRELIRKYHIPEEIPGSFVLIDHHQFFRKSSAALKVLKYFPWYWQGLQLLWIVPGFIRNFIYDIIARNRYAWFGKRDVCMVPTDDVKSRFLN
jgi:predicted DCC family thiol-disulfide oxidoreductase YuxK